MSKQSIIMAVVVVLFVGVISGYIIYQNVTGEPVEEAKGEMSIFLEDIENVTGLGFSNDQEMDFSWMIEQNKEIKEIPVKGRQVEAKKVLITESVKIENYFKDNGFESDMHNVVRGSVIEISGYRKDNVVCLVVTEICTEEATCFDKNNIDIKCGYLDESSQPISFGDVSEQELTVKEGDDFSLSLDMNLSTGYQWQMDSDRDFIQFLDVNYTSGLEKFDFKALKQGKASIIFSYLRPWEEKAPIKKIIYSLIIE